jgi:hypothetical protein
MESLAQAASSERLKTGGGGRRPPHACLDDTAPADPAATVDRKMFHNTKTQRAFRLDTEALHARAQKKEISFALVSMEEAEARGTGCYGSSPRSTGTG